VAKLIVADGPDAGTEFDLDVESGQLRLGDRLSVGRDPQAAVPLSDPAVSREHFRLEVSPRGFRLIDCGSRNRTYVNGRAVKEEILADGDTIRVGDTELRYEGTIEALHSEGVESTIIKEIPAERQGTLIERIGVLEQSLEEERSRQALENVRKLFELYGQIAATTSIRQLFQRLIAEVAPALSADTGAVLLPEGGTWVIRARYPETEGEPASFSSSITQKVADDRKAILSAQTRSDDRFRRKKSVIGEEIVSAVAAPIVVGDRTAAILYADRRGSRPPFSEEDLQLLAAAAEPAGTLLESLEEKEELRKENRNLFRSIIEGKKIIGRSPAIAKLLEFIQRAAPTPMTVLIQGETGTGKELVASAVHYASPRRGNPFVAINCAALPESLVESELFGHERGAFTGAVARRKGRFELATKGTVFLDEIGELSLACQAKLLRLLEERKFERVGGVEPIQIDVRVIAATNRNLLKGVGEGTFREDLYYRLNVLNVELPPLRERIEDITLLAEHFLADCCGGVKKLSKAAVEKLSRYAWPGNIRQLRNVIESAVVLGEGSEIQPAELVLPPAESDRLPGRGAHGAGSSTGEAWVPTSLAAVERTHIVRVLEHTGGNKKRAAEILGIERCTLYSKIKSYGLFTPLESGSPDAGA
jgi:Nif-specific regulatory protein